MRGSHQRAWQGCDGICLRVDAVNRLDQWLRAGPIYPERREAITQACGDLVGAERPKAVELLPARPTEASSKSTNAGNE
jgi:hypothetical protein